LWAPYYLACAGGAKTSASLFARLARALHDDAYVDDDSWVNKGRQLFLEAHAEWHDPRTCRRIGSALGNDLGQMRVQFNAKDYAVEPAYRDDNFGLWHLEEGRSQDGAEFESEAMRSVESDAPAPTQRERGEPENASRVQDGGEGGPASGIRPKASTELDAVTRYGEWDYVIQRERPDFCSIKERLVVAGAALPITSASSPYGSVGKRLERFALRLANRRATQVRRLLDGDRLDLPAATAMVVAQASGAPLDQRVYRRLRFRIEPPALLLLLDLSESLNAVSPGADATLLELAQSASALLATSLACVASDLAIHGFSSNGRHDVGYFRFKDFDEPFDAGVSARIAGMRASLSTRLGTALRHAGQALAQRKARRKLLLVVTDGEPSDIDVHDPRYLLFDAKQATIYNLCLGVTSFCVGLDANAEERVRQIFGARNYSLLDRVESLPQRLAELYQRLSA
jgi:nitric oxide reductase activation protein